MSFPATTITTYQVLPVILHLFVDLHVDSSLPRMDESRKLEVYMGKRAKPKKIVAVLSQGY